MRLADKVIFLDRDGVINVCLPGDYVKTIDEFEMLPAVPEALKMLKDGGYVLVLITNQRGIARGLMSADDLAIVHDHMQSELARGGASLDAIFFCPHDYDQCDCRKPKLGMFRAAEERFDVDKSASYMIGDSGSDIEAGKNYGVRTISIRNPKANADHDCDDLLSAANYILGREV